MRRKRNPNAEAETRAATFAAEKMAPGTAAEQRAAIAELQEYGSHTAFDRETADRIAKPFGFTPHLHIEVANNHNNPKGVWIEGGAPMAKVERVGGWTLAAQIAQRVGATVGWQMGRGSQFRQTVANILDKINADPEGT